MYIKKMKSKSRNRSLIKGGEGVRIETDGQANGKWKTNEDET